MDKMDLNQIINSEYGPMSEFDPLKAAAEIIWASQRQDEYLAYMRAAQQEELSRLHAMSQTQVPEDALQFVNMLRKLWSLGKYRLPFLTNDEWVQFRDDPPRYLARCSDKNLADIWHAIGEKE